MSHITGGTPKILLLPGVDRTLALALHYERAPHCQLNGHRPDIRHDVGVTCSHCGLILPGLDP